jgi:hypothetical protein
LIVREHTNQLLTSYSEVDSDMTLSIATRDENDLQEDEGKIPNPLHWFGLLVPAPLREAQLHFSSVVDQPLAKMANSARHVRQLEDLIESQRRKIERLETSANPIASPAKTYT